MEFIKLLVATFWIYILHIYVYTYWGPALIGQTILVNSSEQIYQTCNSQIASRIYFNLDAKTRNGL